MRSRQVARRWLFGGYWFHEPRGGSCYHAASGGLFKVLLQGDGKHKGEP